MRRTLVSLLVAASAAATLGLAAPASAVCGDGAQPWEGCHCPDKVYFFGTTYQTGINCTSS